MKNTIGIRRMAGALVLALAASSAPAESPAPAGYDALVGLFAAWREFERPPLRDGAPSTR
jgi:hypothetical protein